MILSCQNISKAFVENQVLKNVSFHIEDHEKAAIVGINGAGKTTLLRIIVGEITPDEPVWERGTASSMVLSLLPNRRILTIREMIRSSKSEMTM